MDVNGQAELAALADLENADYVTRAAAVNTLAAAGAQFMQPICGRLRDAYPQVRAAAIQALERLQPSGAWRAQLRYECYVPAGKFSMGSADGDENEKPAHEVDVAAFYIGKYPVTNAEYKHFLDNTEQDKYIPSVLTGAADHPVMSVTWHQAGAYVRWANVRLPTEAEWEKAASWRDGHKLRYPWGDEFDPGKCNTTESGFQTTTPVGAYSPQGDSPYGCADMSGNVWEWTSSLYQAYPYDAEDGRENLSSSEHRAVRGGSFNSGRNNARTAYRSRGPGIVWNDIGIRYVISAG